MNMDKMDASKYMDYWTNKQKGVLFGHKDIKLSFLQKEYFYDEEKKETTCRIACKLNLKKLEKDFMLSERLKKMVFNPQMHCYSVLSTEPKVTYQKIGGKRVQVISDDVVETYDYFETFTVAASVRPVDGDEFDEVLGKMLSESKAKVKAYELARQVEMKIVKLFRQVADSFEDYATDMAVYRLEEELRYKDLGGIPYEEDFNINTENNG